MAQSAMRGGAAAAARVRHSSPPLAVGRSVSRRPHKKRGKGEKNQVARSIWTALSVARSPALSRALSPFRYISAL